MAASSTKSKFPRPVSLGIFKSGLMVMGLKEIGATVIFGLLVMLLGLQVLHAEDLPDDSANAGFFILSDRSFSPNEQAQVRLEMQDVQAVNDKAGVEVAVYQVPNPIGFLQAQTNLHRINVKAVPKQAGLWNSVVAVWDKVARSARLLWRAIFSEDARRGTVEVAPDLHQRADLMTGHSMQAESAYKPLAGFTPISRFRYPVQFAKDITPADAQLTGANIEGNIEFNSDSPNNASSSTGSASDAPKPAPLSNGNVYVPLGKLAPGLYVVEAMLGQQRAVTMVFVGNTVAVSKIASSELTVWTVNRATGAPVADVNVHWNDGTADLTAGKTTAQGWVQLQHASPEKTYVYAQDPQGGVLISENFYYDSEIYNTKLFATTDRPLYHAGDTVQIKVVGREFVNARESKALTSAPIQINVLDPNGMPVASQSMTFEGQTGGNAAVRLPAGSASGGYEIQLTYLGEVYSAAFRVADFQKPHFEINLSVDKDQLKTKQAIPAVVQLRYPDGKPVKNARVDLDVKAQALSMVEGDLGYGGLFPIKLTTQQYQTDSNGNVKISLPEVKQPSRYVVSVLATDGAAYRVRHTQELLIERALATWQLDTPVRFSAVHQPVNVSIHQVTAAGPTGQAVVNVKPVRWKLVRLEDNSEQTGDLSGNSFTVKPDKSGSYVISLLAADGSILGATSHWVSGADLKVPTGHIEIVWDKNRYQVGDSASGLITFSEPVDQALITLERDKVEGLSLLKTPAGWLKTEQLSPQQWRISVPVTEQFAPNLTLSVAYVKQDQFVFENAGLVVASKSVEISLTADKTQYAPGEVVKLNVQTRVQGQPVPASVSLGVVDEMIYVLQPEIAPDIHDFFYHPRRNNVRTQYSPSFIGYDLSSNQLDQPASTHSTHERAIKVLERPRRDEVDTAYWAPQLTTNAQGQAQVTFTMPDVLTRWRVTARAMTSDGIVGQNTTHILSNKDVYLKWTSPRWLRADDQSTGNLAIFNQTNQVQKAQLVMQGALTNSQDVTLQPGINFIEVPRQGQQSGALTLSLNQQGQVRDRLLVNLSTRANGRLTHFDRLVSPVNNQLTLGLPADATNVSLRWIDSSRAGFYRVMDNLIDQPYGCVEQTASRMIPLALVYQSLSADDPRKSEIARQLYTQRIRLASMAGDEAKFGWWGRSMAADPFLTTYAYYADWRTAQVLGINLPADHWQRLLDVYSSDGVKQPFWQRALMLDWMRQIGLPVGSMASALATQEVNGAALGEARYGARDSLILSDNSGQTQDLAVLLTSRVLKATSQSGSAEFSSKVVEATARMQAKPTLLGSALLLSLGQGDGKTANALLAEASSEYATIDRAVMLTWLEQSLASGAAAETPATLASPWTLQTTRTGGKVYQWPSASLVKTATPPAPLPTILTSSSNAVLSYDSAQHGSVSTLPATLTHQLYLLKSQSDGSFEAEEVGPKDTIHTDSLYLDTYTLTPKQALHYMVIDAPLPAGAQIEPGTWGIKIKDRDELPRANFQEMTGGYAVPLGQVTDATTVQHLLRFSQRGQYVLPAARAYNMYRPDAQVLESAARNRVTVE
ncbi:alpha-2-macroglobulin family protein [Aquirhabdus parva]|uniref:Alpha-2-macroglobulin family protein n=1 Tax=Aquirhabdus parva TaxID=2283318 RepID=A0A345PAB5_9GAMM|nr:MG2 domain-containing protein [Aquirhabdus parva]AXI04224.1 alpha-2-macroglobulin family protein [Aquirhabdus parva]